MDAESKAVVTTTLRNDLVQSIIEVCGTIEVATNIMVDLCYSNNKSKELLWEVCSEQLIKNLINNGYNKIHFPIKAEDGDLEFKGDRFKMEEVDANGINWE